MAGMNDYLRFTWFKKDKKLVVKGKTQYHHPEPFFFLFDLFKGEIKNPPKFFTYYSNKKGMNVFCEVNIL